MNIKEWQKCLRTRKGDMPDGIVVAYDIDGTPLGEVEYKDGKLVRRTKYQAKNGKGNEREMKNERRYSML